MTDDDVTDLNPTLRRRRRVPVDPIFLFITKVGVRREQPVVRTNLLGPIVWVGKSAPAMPFRPG